MLEEWYIHICQQRLYLTFFDRLFISWLVFSIRSAEIKSGCLHSGPCLESTSDSSTMRQVARS